MEKQFTINPSLFNFLVLFIKRLTPIFLDAFILNAFLHIQKKSYFFLIVLVANILAFIGWALLFKNLSGAMVLYHILIMRFIVVGTIRWLVYWQSLRGYPLKQVTMAVIISTVAFFLLEHFLLRFLVNLSFIQIVAST